MYNGTIQQQLWLLGCSCDQSHGGVWGTIVTRVPHTHWLVTEHVKNGGSFFSYLWNHTNHNWCHSIHDVTWLTQKIQIIRKALSIGLLGLANIRRTCYTRPCSTWVFMSKYCTIFTLLEHFMYPKTCQCCPSEEFMKKKMCDSTLNLRWMLKKKKS